MVQKFWATPGGGGLADTSPSGHGKDSPGKDAMPRDAGKLAYAPTTFEQRGTVVPFTTPVLSQARVRRDSRDRLEILLPGFSASQGVYVVSWSGLPQLISMTVHDRMLHKEVEASKATNPLNIREAALRVARTGIGGQNLAAAARKALQEARDEAHLANLMLLVKVVQFVRKTDQVTVRDMIGEKGQLAARDALVELARQVDKPAQEVFRNAAELSALLSPIGVEGSPKKGRIGKIFDDMQPFHQSVEDWASEQLSDRARYAKFTADTISLTLDISSDLMTDINKWAKAPHRILADWENQGSQMKTLIEKLIWLCDGWDYVMTVWNDAEGKTVSEVNDALEEIVRIIPMVPVTEFGEGAEKLGDALADIQRKRVRLYEDWRSGALDYDVIRRIEILKAQAL